jgi:hypothetical protein
VGGGLFADHLVASRQNEPSDAEDALALRVREAEVRWWGLDLDGRDLSGPLIGLEIMNIPMIGPHVELAAAADPADGRLDLVLLGVDARDDLVARLQARDGVDARPPWAVRSSRRLRVTPPAVAVLHLDDEPVERPGTSWTVSVEIAAIAVLTGAARSAE